MKLLKIINKRYAFFSVLVLITGLILIYFFLQYFINSETIEKLQDTKQYVINSLDAGKNIEFYPLIDIAEVDEVPQLNNTESVKDTVLFNPVENEPDSYKQLSFYHQANNKIFRVMIRTDNIESFDIMLSLGLPLFLLVLVVLLISNIIVNRINFRIWKPFYNNLNLLKKFSAADEDDLKLISSDIDEFKDLNSSLSELTNRIRKDYRELKEFSENASHELQTPLSIIKIKIESLMQDENLEETQLGKIQSVYKMINRLSRLNKSLTLLSKIGSIEYEKKEDIPLKAFILKKAEEFKEIAAEKNISVAAEFEQDKKIKINSDLLEILFSNLFSNAVKYNVENGSINIKLTGNKLIFRNTGYPLIKTPEKMFERFEKGEQSGESSGLGLTIVRQICSINNYEIEYETENAFHIISITFPQ